MRPRPPHLAEQAAERELSEIFWLVKHGARMTGMPAFGPSHDDPTLWGISEFVKELPGMTPEAYEAAGADRAGSHQH
jgi:mono/diheme cytochrome c family protein